MPPLASLFKGGRQDIWMKTQELGPCPLELKYKTEPRSQRPNKTMAQPSSSVPLYIVNINWREDDEVKLKQVWAYVRTVEDPLHDAPRIDLDCIQPFVFGVSQGQETQEHLRKTRKRQREQEDEKEEKTRKKMKKMMRQVMDEEIKRAVELLKTTVQDLASSTIPPSREEEPEEEEDDYAPQELAPREDDEGDPHWVRGGPGSPYYRRTGNFGDDTANEQ